MLRKRLHSRMLGLLLAAVTATVLAAPASAANTYYVNSCADHSTRSIDGWVHETTAGQSGGTPYFWEDTDCSRYGFLRRFEVGTIAAGAYAAWIFNAPSGTWVDAITLHQSINPSSPGAYDAIYATMDDNSRSTVANYIGNTGTVVGDRTYSMPQATHPVSVRTELGCQINNNCSGTWNGAAGNVWQINGAVVRLADPSAPSFNVMSGTGWQPQPPDGVDPVNYKVLDSGSGVASVHFYIDGVDSGVQAKTCYAGDYQPCPLAWSGSFMLDTTQLAEGQHTISLAATDFAGNSSPGASKAMAVTVRRRPAIAADAPVTTSDPDWNGGGSPAVGDDLTGQAGNWSGDGITYGYQWQRCDTDGLNCVPITGANSLTYTATQSDVGRTLVFCVTARNSGGSATSCSAPTPVVVASHPAPAPPPSQTGSGDATPASPGGDTAQPTPLPQVPSTSTTSTSSTTTTTVSDTIVRGAANGAPASDRAVLSAVTNSRTSIQKVKFGKRVPISGRLLAPNGDPIAGALLAVQVQTAIPGASMADSAQVVTGRDGRFTYVAPAGPSRTVRFGYRAYTSDTSFADTTDVRLLVSAGVTIKATPKKVRNRHATVFTGRLLGKPLSKRGVIVDLQVFYRKQWRTFAAPRANKRGVYRFKYRFMAGNATWRFRARVRKESSYPYELGYSGRQVKVKVTG